MSNLDPSFSQCARRAAEVLLAEIAGADAIVVATVDGFDLASVGPSRIDPSRFAAMVSSFAALGDVASRDSGIGTPSSLVIDSSEGRIVVRCIQVLGETIIVAVLSDRTALLGSVLNRLVEAEHLMNAR